MNRRSVLLAIGVISLCGCGCMSLSWWAGLNGEGQASALSNAVMSFTCCLWPMLFGLGGWHLNNLHRNGWRWGVRQVEEL